MFVAIAEKHRVQFHKHWMPATNHVECPGSEIRDVLRLQRKIGIGK